MQIGAILDGEEILASRITVSSLSTKLLTIVKIILPEHSQGTPTLRLYPKNDPFSGNSVEFGMLFTDPSSLFLLQPFKASGPNVSDSGSTSVLRVGNFPVASAITYTLIFQPRTGAPITANIVRLIVGSDQIAAITYSDPVSPVLGAATATLTVRHATNPAVADKSVSYTYTFYDGRSVRLRAINPDRLPTQTIVYGRAVQLTPVVSAHLANVPQHLSATNIGVLMGTAEAHVLSLTHTKSCASTKVDCNRSTITFRSVSLTSPGPVTVTITAQGADLIRWTVQFLTPCDYEDLCGRGLRVADIKGIRDRASVSCDLSLCVSSNELQSPSLQRLYPSSAPASVGAVVTVEYENFAAFTLNDFRVTIGSGATRVPGTVLSITPAPGSSLRGNRGSLRLTVPPVPGGNTKVLSQVLVDLHAGWGSMDSALQFIFEYTPVVEGPPTLSSVYPAELPVGSLLQRVSVELTNFPFLRMLLPYTQIRASFQGSRDIAAHQIVFSSFESTSAIFLLNTTDATIANLDVYYNPHGIASVSSCTRSNDICDYSAGDQKCNDCGLAFVIQPRQRAIQRVNSFIHLFDSRV